MEPLPCDTCLLCRYDGLYVTHGRHRLGSLACPHRNDFSFIEETLSHLRKRSDRSGDADRIVEYLATSPLLLSSGASAQNRPQDDAEDASLSEIVQKYASKTRDPFDFILDLSGLSPIQFEFSERQWQSLVADCPNIGTTNQYNIEAIIKQLFGTTSEEISLLEARRRWEGLRDLKPSSPIDKDIIWWIEGAIGKFLNSFESKINPLAEGCRKGEYLVFYITPLLQGALNIGTFCRHRWYTPVSFPNEAVDLLTTFKERPLLCGLIGQPQECDITKYYGINCHLARFMKSMLNALYDEYRQGGKDPSHLFTLGVQTYMSTIKIFMLEKREVYRLHLLQMVHVPFTFPSYDKLGDAIRAAWNLRALINYLVGDIRKMMRG
ncbi:hypothetical protein BC936DRAFT_136967 [Jimgerdemannia flammicorona]|uniref:Uncharacterized protein n=1 Tax=Jimgerdemannia flammicorona TaxID=994334 RepID=A0A433CYD2_9FUNG|nr:hypothetical protein BC936DRAFT_136967 [Jimgerdemannia flammicorona]